MKRDRVIAFLLIVAMVGTLIGCSTSNSEDGKKVEEARLTTGKYDPPITLTTVQKKPPTLKYADGDSIDNNPWTRAYEEEYGIKIKTLWSFSTTEEAQWQQKTNLMIASGDLPDFFLATPEQFKQLLDADLLADLTKEYNNAPKRVRDTLVEGGELPIKSATKNGKLMAIPFTTVVKEGSHMIWIRTDWLKKLNLPEPKTMSDVLAISEAFTTKDPDGNGKNDTFGITLDKDFRVMKGFLNGYHAYLDIWVKNSSNQLVFSSVQPEMKKALGVLSEMFKKGQIDPEFGSKAYAKASESLVNGKIGILFNSFGAALSPLQSGIDIDPRMEWKAFPIVSVDSTPAKNQNALGVNGYWVVKKGVKNADAVFKMIDFWIKTFYENKDMDTYYKYVNIKDTNIEASYMNVAAIYKPFKNTDQHLKVIKAAKDGDVSALTGDDKGVLERVKQFQAGNRTMWAWQAIYGEGGSLSVSDYYRKKELYEPDQFISAPLPVMAQKGAALAKLENEVFTKIILGQVGIDEFDKFVEEWKKTGGTEITAEVNEWYKQNK
ncbi:extracellular solute-binding protein [Paenibacillus koleovorans]|uniref:extracellular solute-binding protein n=1 Tax=Paenibacillus koleovorans TaxID=121608 RepID=UPI000FD825B5|nr:extracellular solute-binding protein [Paenibacillus koleovorans]